MAGTLFSILACAPPPPRLELTVLDAATGVATPARVEVVDGRGVSYIADGALRVAGDCGWTPIHNWIGWWGQIQMLGALQAEVHNPFTDTTQFYVDRPVELQLPPGSYRVRVFKGLEYKVATEEIEVAAGSNNVVSIEVSRWVDLPSEGWYSADDHLHIARPHPRFDPRIIRWMQAEDLHVANLLQMGLAQGLHITPQFGFGESAIHHDHGTIIASGQENPRTHVLGHAITLGADDWLDFPEDYLAYDRLWRRARDAGAVNGYAHWGLGGADEGFATWAPEGLLDFLEVLGFGIPYYPFWYDLLNLGFRITPTAGTDYPCGPGLPGRERFYTRLDESLSYGAWIEAVRRGRTFVTNGPVLELSIEGVAVGDELFLEEPREILLEGRVRFDPGRDDVTRLEVVRAGEVVSSVEEGAAPGVLSVRVKLAADRTTWFALRASGAKVGETPVDGIQFLEQALTYLPRETADRLIGAPDRVLPRNGDPRPSAAHTAPIYVSVARTAPLEAQAPARAAAARLLSLLGELEDRFDDERIQEMAGFPGRGDGVGDEDLRRGRSELLASVEKARRHYQRLLRTNGPRSNPEPGSGSSGDVVD